jgi:4-amino-4-deoxy-L-arabinose transferase-like glycosyltransferase
MQIVPWIGIAIIILSAYPLARGLLQQSPHPSDWLLTLTLTLGLSIGTITLIMFWFAMINNYIDGWGITLTYGVIMLVGAVFFVNNKGRILHRYRFGINNLPRLTIYPAINNTTVLFLMGVIACGILFNAVYWPFYRSDAVSIYADQAHFMYVARIFIPLRDYPNLGYYQAYPPLIPLAYTYTYLVSGWENEYLAKVIPALLSLGCILNVFLLGRMWRGASVGKIAALLFMLTPSFVRWASSGYVDLPMAFFYTLGAIFAWRLLQFPNFVDAVLAGLMAGLAAWTKNVGLLGILCFTAWLLIEYLRKKVSFRHIAVFIVSAVAIAGPWYLRNWVEAQLIFPPTIWIERSERTLNSLLIFVNAPLNFALSGYVVMLAILWIPYRLTRWRQQPYDVTLFLCLSIPFFLFWWIFASYDPRFLLLFFPFLCILGAEWITFVFGQLSDRNKRMGSLVFYAAIVGIGIYCAWISVDYKEKALRNLFMSDSDKRAVVLGAP